MTDFTLCCQKASFALPAFYFLKLELSPTSLNNPPTRYRTEVSKETAFPEYQTSSFRFPIPTNDGPLKLSVVACKIARNAETGTRVDVVGAATLDVKPMLEGWLQSQKAQPSNPQNVFSTSLRLTQTNKPELMNVGHLDVTITFPSVAPNKPNPSSISATEMSGNHQNRSREGRKLPDAPFQYSSSLNNKERSLPRIPDLTYPNGTYQFLIHAVHLLPNNSPSIKNESGVSKEEVPAIFVCVKTLHQAQQKEPANAATRVANVSRDPYFGETLFLNIPSSDSSSLEDPTIVISVADEKSSTYISTYILPLSAKQFTPFRQVTLMLGPPKASANPFLHNKSQQKAILLLSITSYDAFQSVAYMPTSLLRSAYPDDIIRSAYPQTDNIFIEIVVKHLRQVSTLTMEPPAPFFGVPRSLIVIARVVKNGDEYIGRVETWRKRLQAGLPVEPPHALQNIAYCSFDSSGELLGSTNVPANDNNWVYISNAATLDDETSDGGKVSKSEESGVKLTWNEYFVCPVEKSALSDQNALVIEFHSSPLHPSPLISPPEHPSSSSFTGMFWGYGIVNLTDSRLVTTEDDDKMVAIDDVSVQVITPDVMDANNPRTEKITGRNRIVCGLDLRVPRRWTTLSRTIPTVAGSTKSEQKSNENENGNGNVPNPVEAENIQMIRKEMALENATFQDAQQRQKLVDRLLSELDTRTQAVKTLSQEIVFLRETNSELKSQNQDLRYQLQDKTLKTKQLVNQADIDVLSHDELKRRFAFIVEKFAAEMSRSKDLSSRLETLQDVVIERNDLQKKTMELRHAHTAQQAYVQKLQERVNETAKYRSTIKKQEQVIRKMEEFLQVTLAGPQKASFEAFLDQKGDVRVSKQKSNENLGSGTNSEQEGQEQIQAKGGKVEEGNGRKVPAYISEKKLRKSENPENEPKVATSAPIATDRSDNNTKNDFRGEVEIMDDADVLKLLVRAESAEARVVALEQELVESVKNFGRQIGDLKLELQESYLQGPGRTIPDTTSWYSMQDEIPPAQPSKPARSRSSSAGKSTRTKPSGYLQPLARDIF